jgi:hypothetical protein
MFLVEIYAFTRMYHLKRENIENGCTNLRQAINEFSLRFRNELSALTALGHLFTVWLCIFCKAISLYIVACGVSKCTLSPQGGF